AGGAGLLAISEKGLIDGYATNFTGEVGPLDALFSGTNVRRAIKAAVGDLRVGLDGSVGRFDPLHSAILNVKVENADVGAMLKKLQLPAVATGPLTGNARLSDAGERPRLDLDAKLGDITAKANGTLRTLSLTGADLQFAVTVPDTARVASAFGVTGVPAAPLEAGGRISS